MLSVMLSLRSSIFASLSGLSRGRTAIVLTVGPVPLLTFTFLSPGVPIRLQQKSANNDSHRTTTPAPGVTILNPGNQLWSKPLIAANEGRIELLDRGAMTVDSASWLVIQEHADEATMDCQRTDVDSAKASWGAPRFRK
jgi:hypothetical protein